MSNISRRDFLKGTLAGTAAVVVNGALGATAAFADEQPAAVEAAAPAAAAVSAVLPWTELNPQDASYTKNTTDFSAIFSPIQIGNVTLKNRIIKTAAGSDTMIPNTELMDEIAGAGFTVYAAGCDAPSNIQTSIHAGYKVSRYLE